MSKKDKEITRIDKEVAILKACIGDLARSLESAVNDLHKLEWEDDDDDEDVILSPDDIPDVEDNDD